MIDDSISEQLASRAINETAGFGQWAIAMLRSACVAMAGLAVGGFAGILIGLFTGLIPLDC